MRPLLAAISAALALVVCVNPAEAKRHGFKSQRTKTIVIVKTDEKLKSDMADLRRELQFFRELARGPSVLGTIPAGLLNPVVASLGPPDVKIVELPKDILARVFPATCIERGQFRDRRRTHLHAGIDCMGERGSPIVASIGGRVLRAPGGDRGYGPHVRVILGDDGIVYRYAHMQVVSIKVGDRVETGQQIGTMGIAGRSSHLHFETKRYASYRSHPYGPNGIDPNKLLGLARGARMVAGDAMPVVESVMLASAEPVADRTRIKKRHHVRRDYARRHGHRYARA